MSPSLPKVFKHQYVSPSTTSSSGRSSWFVPSHRLHLKPSHCNWLDEIHIKPKISYDSGQLYRNASKRDQQQHDSTTTGFNSNRIQTYKISDISSQNNDVVPLVPVQKMTAHDLYTITLEVIKNVVTACYRIVAIII